MRSLRHPNILIFYGAGVDSESRAFLVTELMTGSLKTLLLNLAEALDWSTRLTFGIDSARGMAYLHDKGTVHRGNLPDHHLQ
jgi:serine/threonine protein kinase